MSRRHRVSRECELTHDVVFCECVPTRHDVWRSSGASSTHRERRWRSAPRDDHDDVGGEETKDGARRRATVASEKVERRRGVTRAWVARRGGV